MLKRLLCSAALLAGLSGAAEAAGTANSLITAQTPNRGLAQFLQGTDAAGTYKTIYTGGANGSKCFSLFSTNNDASATHLLTVQIYSGSVYYGGEAVTTALNAGFAAGTLPQNLLS